MSVASLAAGALDCALFCVGVLIYTAAARAKHLLGKCTYGAML
jgi:hypothetical protein